MSIKKSFSGSSIRKPGAYSTSKVDQSGGSPLGANGTLFLMGEADTGAPGDVEGIQSFSSSELADLVAEYTSGPLVDCAKAALVSPSKTPGVGQADKVLIWKTNSSTQAAKTFSSKITFTDRNYGAYGNQISITLANGTSSTLQRIITVQRGTDRQVLDQNDASPQLVIQYTGAGSASTLTIGGTLTNKTFATTCTGAAGDNISLNLNDYATIQDLYLHLSLIANYTVTLGTSSTAATTAAKDLDPVTAVDIKTGTVSLYRLQQEIVDLVNSDAELVVAAIAALATGIPATAAATFLTGGAKGASTSTDFSDGMAKSLSLDWNVGLPAISRDCAADITDGLTDSGSTYDIDSVSTALDTHLRLRGSVKNKKEAQGMIGRRDAAIATTYTAAETLNSELIQVFPQDVLIVDVNGNLSWKFPHVQAALAAGTRLGTDVGEPLTFKYLNTNGIGHVVNATTGIAAGDFDPNTNFDAAIDAGVTFCEQSAGGFRIVVDNTSYGKDESFVFNRGSVLEAAQYCAKTLRETAELVFVGQKTSNGVASSIKSVLRNKLIELNKAQIITSSDDGAPQGFKESTFTVIVTGNTANIAVEIKPVQGLDFLLITFTLGDLVQSA